MIKSAFLNKLQKAYLPNQNFSQTILKEKIKVTKILEALIY